MSKNNAVVQSVSAMQSYSGPLPHPRDFAEYERTLSGAAERILAMAEREAAFRHEAERSRLATAAAEAREARSETRRGQLLASALTCLAFLSAVACAALKQPWVAGIIAGTTLVSVVTAIMRQRAK